jgi:hypothetical protein
VEDRRVIQRVLVGYDVPMEMDDIRVRGRLEEAVFCRSRLYEILPMIVISEDAYALDSGGAVISRISKEGQ